MECLVPQSEGTIVNLHAQVPLGRTLPSFRWHRLPRIRGARARLILLCPDIKVAIFPELMLPSVRKLQDDFHTISWKGGPVPPHRCVPLLGRCGYAEGSWKTERVLGKGVGHSGQLFVFVLELEDLRNQIYALGKNMSIYVI